LNRMDRRNWAWLPGRLRFRVLGLIDVVTLWAMAVVLVGTGVWWGLDTYREDRDYCTGNHELRRMGSGEECIGVTAMAYPFDPDLADVLRRIKGENDRARKSGKMTVSVAVVMPYTSKAPGAAMSKELIRHSLQGAYIAQRNHNNGHATGDTAIQLLFANVGEDLRHWRTVTNELASRVHDEAPLVAAIGLPNSHRVTLQSVEQGLGHKQIPAVSAVLSSPDMENRYLFKVSPSTDQLVDALKRYVNATNVNRKDTFLIADERDDNYVANLRRAFRQEFGAQYGITNNDKVNRSIETYQGKMGPVKGTTQIFGSAVDTMCAVGARTVFLAGRDADLPPFLKTIDGQPSCGRGPDDEPMRILRVSTGRDPVTETAEMREIAERDKIEIVTAVAVDAPRWRSASSGDDQVPKAFALFAGSYDRQFGEEKTDALNDGYAVMYHDALTAVGTAVAAARHSGIRHVNHDNVYAELRRGSPQHCAVNCVPGASGVFTFADESLGTDEDAWQEAATGLWPVCKPVPVVTFPKERPSSPPLYRTYQERGKNSCPHP
jgi:hypothetical protein